MAVLLTALLQKFLAEHPDWRVQLARQWKDVFGVPAPLLRLKGYRARRLIIGVGDTRWLHELKGLTPQYVAKLRTLSYMPPCHSIEWIYDAHVPPVVVARPLMVSRIRPIPPACAAALQKITNQELRMLLHQCIAQRQGRDE